MRDPCCTLGYGGPWEIKGDGYDPGTRDVWHITWLPKGYGPSFDQKVMCVLAVPPGESAGDWGLSRETTHPLARAVSETIETFMRAHYAHPAQNER